MKLEGKIAVVTGAKRGIGASIVRKFLDEGIEKIACIGRSSIDTSSIDPSGQRAFSYICDVSDSDSVKETFAKIYSDLGRVDILVNCAGITKDAMFHKMTDEQWKAVIDTNLNSVYYTCREVICKMRAQMYGRIISISSTSIRGNVGQCNYSASKAALVGFTRSLAKESGRKNITVNCVAPGATNTDMYAAVPAETLEKTLSKSPFGRLAEPAEIASAVAYLASEEASFISGQCVIVNGGA